MNSALLILEETAWGRMDWKLFQRIFHVGNGNIKDIILFFMKFLFGHDKMTRLQ